MSQQDGEEEQQGPDAMPIYPEKGPDREEMAADYLPESDHWAAKTQLDINDPAAIAALTQFDKMFPEVDDLQPMIDGFLEEFLPARTSVSGKSREEYGGILKSMYGGSDEDHGGSGVIVQGLGADED